MVRPPMTALPPDSTPTDELVSRLAEESRLFDATARDPERNCWLVVHRHAHGVLPSEYDIRDVPEDLYLAVLARRKQLG
jgi:proteasome lid subunit RPN8/RPN11